MSRHRIVIIRLTSSSGMALFVTDIAERSGSQTTNDPCGKHEPAVEATGQNARAKAGNPKQWNTSWRNRWRHPV